MNYRTTYDQVKVPVATKKSIQKVTRGSAPARVSDVVLENLEVVAVEPHSSGSVCEEESSVYLAEESSDSDDGEKKNW